MWHKKLDVKLEKQKRMQAKPETKKKTQHYQAKNNTPPPPQQQQQKKKKKREKKKKNSGKNGCRKLDYNYC